VEEFLGESVVVGDNKSVKSVDTVTSCIEGLGGKKDPLESCGPGDGRDEKTKFELSLREVRKESAQVGSICKWEGVLVEMGGE